MLRICTDTPATPRRAGLGDKCALRDRVVWDMFLGAERQHDGMLESAAVFSQVLSKVAKERVDMGRKMSSRPSGASLFVTGQAH